MSLFSILRCFIKCGGKKILLKPKEKKKTKKPTTLDKIAIMYRSFLGVGIACTFLLYSA